MKRLTTHDPNRQLVVCSANYKSRNEIYDRLAYYEDLEEQGRLVVLPCKVGDTVWEIGYDCEIDYEDMCAFPAPSCDECEFVKRVIVPVRVDSVTAATFLIGKIGTTAFFSFEEAEAALRGVSEDA